MGPTDDIRGLGVTKDRLPPAQRPVTQSVPTLSSNGRMLDLDSVKAQLAQGIRVKVDGFGTFKPRGRNVTFSADRALKDLIRPLQPQGCPTGCDGDEGPIGDRRPTPQGQSQTPPF